MTLEATCPQCNQSIKFNAVVNDRVELASKKGELMELQCPACKAVSKIHVDDVSAIQNKIWAATASIILIGGMITLSMMLPKYLNRVSYIYAIGAVLSVFLVPFMVYWSINKSQRDRISTFNGHKFRGESRSVSFKRRFK